MINRLKAMRPEPVEDQSAVAVETRRSNTTAATCWMIGFPALKGPSHRQQDAEVIEVDSKVSRFYGLTPKFLELAANCRVLPVLDRPSFMRAWQPTAALAGYWLWRGNAAENLQA